MSSSKDGKESLEVKQSGETSHPPDLELATASVTEETPVPAISPPDFPEGGWTAWLTVLGGFMIVFCSFGVVQSFGVYQDFYTREFLSEHSPSVISWIGSIQVFFLFTIGLPAGKLFDEGYFHHTTFAGSVIYLFSAFMLSLAHPHKYYQVFLSQGVGMGIGMGLMFLPALSITSHFFRKRRSLAMGVVLSGSSIGAVVYPILLNNLFNGSAGFPWGVRAAGFLELFLLTCANLLMRTRLPSRKNRPDAKPVDMRGVVTDTGYLFCVAGAFLVFWGLFVPFFYLQLFADLHKISPHLSLYSITILNSASFFGRTVPNMFADKWGPFNTMIPFTVLSSGLVFAMFGASTRGGMIIFALLYGFCSGGFISIITPASASFARDINELGIRIGLVSFACGFASLTGTPIAGALLSPPRYTWYRPFIFATVTIAAGALSLILSRRLLAKRRGMQRV